MKHNTFIKLAAFLFCFIWTLSNTKSFSQSWSKVDSIPGQYLTSFCYTGIDTGYAVGWGGAIFKTTNSGSSWEKQNSGTTDNINSIFSINKNFVYAVGGFGNQVFFKTINEGNSWSTQTRDSINSLLSVYFINQDIGYSVGWLGTILKTIDGGNTWSSQISGTTTDLRSVFFINSKNGFTVGNNGILLKTNDGGITWKIQNINTTKDLLYTSFIDSLTGFILGKEGIFKTTDGGNTWIKHQSGVNYPLVSLYFIDSNIGYAVGVAGTIVKTNDGGNTWIQQASGITNENLTINSVWFTNVNIGYALGSYSLGGSVILKYSYTTIPKPADNINGTVNICKGQDSITYSVPVIEGATNYIWSLPNGVMGKSSKNSIKVFFNSTFQSGKITVKGHNSYGDGTESSLDVVVNSQCNPNEIKNISQNEFTIYPNPTTGVFKISMDKVLDKDYNIEVYNNLGKLIKNKVCNNTVNEIDLTNYPAGLYIIHLNQNDRTWYEKIFKQ